MIDDDDIPLDEQPPEPQQQIVLFEIPKTAVDLRPPRSSDINTEAANFLRAHWEEVRPFYASIGGEIESIHGSRQMDEAWAVFEVQRIAKQNGFARLGDVKAAELRRALRVGFKRNTGFSVTKLERQGIRLRLEHKD